MGCSIALQAVFLSIDLMFLFVVMMQINEGTQGPWESMQEARMLPWYINYARWALAGDGSLGVLRERSPLVISHT